jgi:hypothetical protein
MRTLLAVLLLLCPILYPLASGAGDLRLTGIIGSAATGGDALAVLVQGDGQQKMVKVGDSLGDAQVARIDVAAMAVTLTRGDQTEVLRLAGNTTVPLVADDAAAAGPPSGLDWGDGTDQVTMLGVTDEQIRALHSLATAPDAGDRQARGDRFSQVLGLEAGTRITALDEQAVTGAEQALQQIPWEAWQSAPDGAHLVVLDTQTDRGPGRVYVEKRAGDAKR